MQRELLEEALRASVRLRLAERAPVPGDSIAEIEANTPAAQRRTAAALMAWRSTMDAYLEWASAELAASGNATAPAAFPPPADAAAPCDADPTSAGSASVFPSCAKGDSNPHGVTH
jgi:hypothetical protein